MNLRYRFLASLAILAAGGCGEPAPVEFRLSGSAMGTTFNVAIVARRDFDDEHWRQHVHAVLGEVDARMSTYREDSEVTRFNRSTSTGWFDVSPQLCRAVSQSLDLNARTGGAFDITVAPLVDIWGFGPGGARTAPPDNADIDAALRSTGSGRLRADCTRGALRKEIPGLQIDLSGFAKGLAADLVAAGFDDGGLRNYLVEVGGELRTRGLNAEGRPWRIAIETPDSDGRAIERIVPWSDGAVATSGDYRNYFESGGRRYSHTIDPRTGRPVTHRLASASVLAGTAAEADALATALMVLGPDAALEFAERENVAAYLLVRDGDGFTERMSPAFAALAAE